MSTYWWMVYLLGGVCLLVGVLVFLQNTKNSPNNHDVLITGVQPSEPLRQQTGKSLLEICEHQGRHPLLLTDKHF